jgi:hypothetical protein
MHVVVREEFFILLITHAAVNQDFSFPFFDQQATERPGAHIVLIGRVQFVPDRLGYYTEHGTAVQFKITGVYGVEFHDCNIAKFGTWFAGKKERS